VPNLADEPIEDFSMRVAETWKLGRALRPGVVDQGVTDNGLLLVVARDDRKMRIEVGYGLEGTVTDLLAKRILTNVIAPRFKAGDFAGGISAGIDAVGGAIRDDPSAIALAEAPAEEAGDDRWLVLGIAAFFAVFLPGLFGWLAYLFVGALVFWAAGGLGTLGAFLAALAWLLFGGLARLFVWRVLPKIDMGRMDGGSSPGGPVIWSGSPGSGGWRTGGWSGGSSGGGFSGGGGSFGGGGASGGW
jgi:uncharacterized protein